MVSRRFGLPISVFSAVSLLKANHMRLKYSYLRPKGRGTKASGGVRHGDSYKGIITDIDVYI